MIHFYRPTAPHSFPLPFTSEIGCPVASDGIILKRTGTLGYTVFILQYGHQRGGQNFRKGTRSCGGLREASNSDVGRGGGEEAAVEMRPERVAVHHGPFLPVVP